MLVVLAGQMIGGKTNATHHTCRLIRVNSGGVQTICIQIALITYLMGLYLDLEGCHGSRKNRAGSSS